MSKKDETIINAIKNDYLLQYNTFTVKKLESKEDHAYNNNIDSTVYAKNNEGKRKKNVYFNGKNKKYKVTDITNKIYNGKENTSNSKLNRHLALLENYHTVKLEKFEKLKEKFDKLEITTPKNDIYNSHANVSAIQKLFYTNINYIDRSSSKNNSSNKINNIETSNFHYCESETKAVELQSSGQESSDNINYENYNCNNSVIINLDEES